jgi:alkylation response protein AidB-like acyl-CoA dehydrogenase
MNFDFSEDQKELRDLSRRFLEDQCPTTVPRRVLEGDEPYAEDLWRSMAEMGWMGTALPEEYGGAGFGYLELCVIAEQIGRAVAPVPFSSSVYLAAEAILAAGSDAQKENFLPKIASGEIIGTLAVAEGPGATTPQRIATTFSGAKISGTKVAVPDGSVAHTAVVAAKEGNDVGLYLVDLNGSGVTRAKQKSIDESRSFAKITFENADAEPLMGDGWATLQNVYNRAAILMAFEQVGGATICLEMARAYSLERYAFGRAIGSFQAVKHILANMYVHNELARANAYYGAWALSSDAPELPLAAAAARVSGIQAYHFASKENIQVHGGIGFTWEADCHLYYRRSRVLALNIGSARVWKDKLVTAMTAQTASVV